VLRDERHLAQLDLRETEYPKGFGTLATLVDEGLQMFGRASQGSMPCDHGTKNWLHL
jgi:hypothetical protein